MSTKPLAQQVVSGDAGAESSTASRGAARPRDSWFHLCGTADAIRLASRSDEKRSLLEAYFGDLAADNLAPAARFFAGVILPGDDPRILSVDRTITVSAIRGLTRVSAERLLDLTMKLGDLGDAAGEVFSGRLPSGLAVTDVEAWVNELAAADSDPTRLALVRGMLEKVGGIEAQYVVRLMSGNLGIGVHQSLVEEALANAFSERLGAVRQAMSRHGDIGTVARLARQHLLDQEQR